MLDDSSLLPHLLLLLAKLNPPLALLEHLSLLLWTLVVLAKLVVILLEASFLSLSLSLPLPNERTKLKLSAGNNNNNDSQIGAAFLRSKLYCALYCAYPSTCARAIGLLDALVFTAHSFCACAQCKRITLVSVVNVSGARHSANASTCAQVNINCR